MRKLRLYIGTMNLKKHFKQEETRKVLYEIEIHTLTFSNSSVVLSAL